MSDYIKPVAGALIPHIGGILGSFVSRSNIKSWYEVRISMYTITTFTAFLFVEAVCVAYYPLRHFLFQFQWI